MTNLLSTHVAPRRPLAPGRVDGPPNIYVSPTGENQGYSDTRAGG
jgi:hypothetical protein